MCCSMQFVITKIIVPCYIGETKFKAGIFLSRQIINRKKYKDSLKITEFSSYDEAKQAFLSYYKHISEDELRLNCLYEVRDRHIYTVFSTMNAFGIVEEETRTTFLPAILGDIDLSIRFRYDLTYEEAQKVARNIFVRIYKRPEYYIRGNIPLNRAITLQEVQWKKRKGE